MWQNKHNICDSRKKRNGRSNRPLLPEIVKHLLVKRPFQPYHLMRSGKGVRHNILFPLNISGNRRISWTSAHLRILCAMTLKRGEEVPPCLLRNSRVVILSVKIATDFPWTQGRKANRPFSNANSSLALSREELPPTTKGLTHSPNPGTLPNPGRKRLTNTLDLENGGPEIPPPPDDLLRTTTEDPPGRKDPKEQEPTRPCNPIPDSELAGSPETKKATRNQEGKGRQVTENSSKACGCLSKDRNSSATLRNLEILFERVKP